MRESDSQRGDWLLEVAGVDLPVSYFGDRELRPVWRLRTAGRDSQGFLIIDSCYCQTANRQ